MHVSITACGNQTLCHALAWQQSHQTGSWHVQKFCAERSITHITTARQVGLGPCKIDSNDCTEVEHTQRALRRWQLRYR